LATPNYVGSPNLKWEWHCRDADAGLVSDPREAYVGSFGVTAARSENRSRLSNTL
jgi:hypothetical protein